MISRLPLLVWLVLVWLALWGEVTVANVVSGLAVGVALLTAFPRPRIGWAEVLRPWRALVFLGYFLFQVCEATVFVAWEVVRPRSTIREGIVGVPLTADSDAVVTVVANAITLTPGTLSLEVSDDPPTLFVHALHLRDVEEVRMEVRQLERLALRAYGRHEVAASGPRTANRHGRSPRPARSIEGPSPGEAQAEEEPPQGRDGEENAGPGEEGGR